MFKAYILVVEDESLMYRRLRNLLTKENYTVSEYTPSVGEAVDSIEKNQPDLVLLDIQLQGERTGLDLGKILDQEYQIPFIYITDFDDDETFFKARETHQQHFFVKTKPRLHAKELLRVIQTALFNSKSKKESSPLKKTMLAYVDYIENTKNLGIDDEQQKKIALEDICYITTNSEILDKEKTKTEENQIFKKIKTNYVRIVDWTGTSLYLPWSIKKTKKHFPDYFVQINGATIINLLSDEFTGLINGSRIKIKDKTFVVSKTFKEEVQHKIDTYFITAKNSGK